MKSEEETSRRRDNNKIRQSIEQKLMNREDAGIDFDKRHHQ